MSQAVVEPTTLPQLIGVDDVAKTFGVCPQVVRKWIARGRLPRPLRVGKFYRWRASDIAAFIDSQAGEGATK